MRIRGLILLCSILLGGCASRDREKAAESRGYERGYRQAVQENYWIIQQLQGPGHPVGKGDTP